MIGTISVPSPNPQLYVTSQYKGLNHFLFSSIPEGRELFKVFPAWSQALVRVGTDD